MAITRVGNRTGQSKSTAPGTDEVEYQYRQMTGQQKVEFSLLVRKELANAVPGAIRTLASVANAGKPAQAAVAAARQIVLLAEKHGILRSTLDPFQALSEELQAGLEDLQDDTAELEDRRED